MNLDTYYPLGFLPTPLEKLANLSKLYPGYELYIKRDDQTGLATGGNKTRKLEYLIYDALQQGCDTVISAGAQQSNHCRQTAAAAAKAGLQCHLLLGGTEPELYTGNLLLSKLLGARIHFTGEHRKGEDIPALQERLGSEGRKPCLIPYGGSNGIGVLGYARAVRELSEQARERDIEPDYIFFASSSGGTHAGMLLGKELAGLRAEIIGISIDKDEIHGRTLEEYICELASETGPSLGIKRGFSPGGIILDRSYDAPGYGVITGNEKRAIRLLAENEGILLDPVYTARAFYGMIDHIETGKIPRGSRVLFWHTGGFPANFYYAAELG